MSDGPRRERRLPASAWDSEQDDRSRSIEEIARNIGIECDCRLMHRSGFIDEDAGDWVPPYDEYEVRGKRRSVARGVVRDVEVRFVVFDVEATHSRSFIESALEHLR